MIRRCLLLFAWLALFLPAAAWAASVPTNTTTPTTTVKPAKKDEPKKEALTSLPRGNGVPVIVQVGVAYNDLAGLDENAGTYGASIDLLLRWNDPRLKDKKAPAGAPPVTFTSKAADKKIKEIWVPPVIVANLHGKPSDSAYGVRLYPNGDVELTHRIVGDFDINVDVGQFPFDHQQLRIEALVDEYPNSEVMLRFDQDSLDFSRPSEDANIDGWTIGLVDLVSSPIKGWYNVTQSRVISSLDISRQPGLLVASIFIPLLASLLIPLLAIWLNHMEDGVFQVDAFELVNIIIGGLFAVIALNFTVYSTYGVLAGGDNTVNQLFALNYLALAIALVVNIVFGRFNVVAQVFGPYVQEQTYYVLMWLIPTMVFVTAASFLVSAYV